MALVNINTSEPVYKPQLFDTHVLLPQKQQSVQQHAGNNRRQVSGDPNYTLLGCSVTSNPNFQLRQSKTPIMGEGRQQVRKGNTSTMYTGFTPYGPCPSSSVYRSSLTAHKLEPVHKFELLGLMWRPILCGVPRLRWQAQRTTKGCFANSRLSCTVSATALVQSSGPSCVD